MSFNKDLCDERHDNIGEEFKAVWKRMNGFDKKLWAIIVMLFGNLGALVALLLK